MGTTTPNVGKACEIGGRKTGDSVTSKQLEAGRQAIQNLNLYKKVTLEERADGRGGVEAVYEVKEKWYVLGYPRVRNYDGSWQEWGNREDLPIER